MTCGPSVVRQHPASVEPESDGSHGPARVAVVIPVWNAEDFLAAAARSVRAQTWTDWVCVIVDDGSTDGTADLAREIVDEDPRFLLVRQANQGTPTARNNGLDAVPAGVEFVAFLDGDDVWLPDALAALVETLEASPRAVGAYGNAEYMNTQGEPMQVGVHPTRQRDRRRMGRFDLEGVEPGEPYTWSSLVVSGTLWPSGVALHRREVVERVGRFDPEFRQLQDWELYIRMAKEGAFVPLERHVVWYRQHSSNATSRVKRVAFYTLMVRDRVWQASADEPDRRRELRRIWRRLTLRWTVGTLRQGAHALRERRLHDALRAARGGYVFSRMFVRGHPEAADVRTAALLATYVLAATAMPAAA